MAKIQKGETAQGEIDNSFGVFARENVRGAQGGCSHT